MNTLPKTFIDCTKEYDPYLEAMEESKTAVKN
jgi:hypothetical protein